MKTVRIGVIGTGTMGERHCRVCSNLPRVELVGVADLNEERGRQVADCYDTTFFSDRNTLLAQVEAIIIAASTPTHYTLTAECLERGLHVMVEKPISETVEQARHLAQLADKRG